MRRPGPVAVAALAASLAGCVAQGCAAPSGPAALGHPAPPAAAAHGAAARPIAFATTLRCGGRIATFGSLRASWMLLVDGREIPMREVPGARGARFEAEGDARTRLGRDGDRAQVVLDGTEWPPCSASPPAAGSPPTVAPFAARGMEPFWRLDVDAVRIRFVPNVGAPAVEAPAPAPRAAGAGRRWDARAEGAPLAVTVLDTVCTDPMAGMTHPATVTVEWRGRAHEGCGGEPASLLRGAEWVVEDIDRRGVIDRSRATLAFGADGRISGRASCNDYAGRWTLDGESLRIDGLVLGARSCVPALVDQEARFLARLRTVRRFEIAPDGALLLRDDAGTILARR